MTERTIDDGDDIARSGSQSEKSPQQTLPECNRQVVNIAMTSKNLKYTMRIEPPKKGLRFLLYCQYLNMAVAVCALLLAQKF